MATGAGKTTVMAMIIA
jgi:type III restriction enzyme